MKWSEAVVTDPGPPPSPQRGGSRPPDTCPPSLSYFPFSETKPTFRDHPAASAVQPGPATSRSCPRMLPLPPAALGGSSELPSAPRPYGEGGREGRAQASAADPAFPSRKLLPGWANSHVPKGRP